MKKYFEPEVQVLRLNAKDVICTSPIVFNDDTEGGAGIDIGFSTLR